MITLNGESVVAKLSDSNSLQATLSDSNSISGKISNSNSMVAFLCDQASLNGILTDGTSISAQLTIPNTVTEADEYDGEYQVTPRVADITVLQTRNKILRNNVTIFKVPRWDTSNESGTTVYIGENNGL